MCKAPGAASRDDWVAVGRLLFHDRSASIIARMVGGTMLRRLVKGSPEDVAARKLRRDYVWGELQLTEKHASYQDQFQRDRKFRRVGGVGASPRATRHFTRTAGRVGTG